MDTPDTAAPCEILAVGLNQAWQKILFLDRFTPGQVNRAAAVQELAAGKATNFAAGILQLGGRVTVAQFAGGLTGEWLCADQERRGIRHLTVTTASATRICTTLVSRAEHTASELIEPSGKVTETEFLRLREMILGALAAWRGVGLCGTFPPGVPASFYAETAAAARSQAIVLLDAVRDITDTLRSGVDLLKINAIELRELTQENDPVRAAQALLSAYRISWLAVTAGAETACLARPGESWSFTLPRLAQVVNPIGAGDCVAGVFLWRLLHPGGLGQPISVPPSFDRDRILQAANVVPAYRDALACGSASCLEAAPAAFAVEKAREIAAQIQIRDPGHAT